jgi:hypothetical protein
VSGFEPKEVRPDRRERSGAAQRVRRAEGRKPEPSSHPDHTEFVSSDERAPDHRSRLVSGFEPKEVRPDRRERSGACIGGLLFSVKVIAI